MLPNQFSGGQTGFAERLLYISVLMTLGGIALGCAGPHQAELPLHQAASKGDLQGVKACLAAGARSSDRDSKGYTALHFAARSQDVPDDATKTAIMAALVDAGADVNAKTEDGDTALHFVCFARIRFKGQGGTFEYFPQVKCGEWLISHGADISARNKLGITPLHECGMCDNAEMAEVLLAHGVPVDQTDQNRRTALIWVACGYRLGFGSIDSLIETREVETARALLDHGANVNARFPASLGQEWTALNMAYGPPGSTEYRKLQLGQFLVSRGGQDGHDRN